MKLHVVSRHPPERERPTPLLFIHGMMHGSWCWDVHFLNYFVGQGFAVHAVDLRGHGRSAGRERLRWTRIADFVDDVAETCRTLSNPPILIGHSMGGFIIQKYLEHHDAPGAVLLSSPSPSGLWRTVVRIALRTPLAFLKVNLTLSLLPAIATPGMARASFFSTDLPASELRSYWAQMEDESYRALLDMVVLDLPRPAKVHTPMLVLGAARDNMLAPHEIAATARAYHARCEIIPGVAHDSMLELRWQDVAERILAWLREQVEQP